MHYECQLFFLFSYKKMLTTTLGKHYFLVLNYNLKTLTNLS